MTRRNGVLFMKWVRWRAPFVIAMWLAACGTLHAQQGSRPIARILLGDVALEFRTDGVGTLSIAAAGAARAVALDVRATDARRWADSASRLLRPAPVRKRSTNDVVQHSAAELEEPGAGAGTLRLTRFDSAGTRTFILFVADADLAGVRQELSAADVTTLARLVRRWSALALPPRKAPPAKAKSRRRGTPEHLP